MNRRGFLKLATAAPAAPFLIQWVRPEKPPPMPNPLRNDVVASPVLADLGGAPYLSINGEDLSDSLLRFELHQPGTEVLPPYYRLHVELAGPHGFPEHNNTVVFRHDRSRPVHQTNPEFTFPESQLMRARNRAESIDVTCYGDTIRQHMLGDVTCEADFMLEIFERTTKAGWRERC